MTIPVTNIGFDNIRNEFGGPTPMSLSQYYSGGVLVSNPPPYSAQQTGPIPVTGPISFGNFRGVTKPSPIIIAPPAQSDMYGHSNGPFTFSYDDSYNAYNIHFLFTASGGLPALDPTKSYKWSVAIKPGYWDGRYAFKIAKPQDYAWQGSEIDIPQNTPNDSIMDFLVEGNSSSVREKYIITVSDDLQNVATIEMSVGLWW